MIQNKNLGCQMYINLIFVHRFNKIQLSTLTGSFCFIFPIPTPEKYENTVLFLFEYLKCLQGVQNIQLFKADLIYSLRRRIY